MPSTHTFLLLHGAWHGAWCWSEVRGELEARGAEVVAPTLSGLSERANELSPAVGLGRHLDETLDHLDGLAPRKVVLCAHSYAGMLARGLVDRAPDRLSAILYLDAYLPAPGQCGLDLRSDESNRALLASLIDGWRVPPPPAVNFGVPEARKAEVDARLTCMPLACFQEPLHFSQVSLQDSAYLRTSWPNPGLDAAANTFTQAGRPVHRWDCGHDAMLERPKELARLLEQLAGEAISVD